VVTAVAKRSFSSAAVGGAAAGSSSTSIALRNVGDECEETASILRGAQIAIRP
jgi:hypothetical protein